MMLTEVLTTVSVIQDYINIHKKKVSHFQLQFPRIHDRQSSLYVVDSGQYSADEVTRMKILSYLSML